jgi:hypothetical protein
MPPHPREAAREAAAAVTGQSRSEAEWLALQMSRTAGIAPAGPAPVNEAAEQMEVIAALAKELNSAEGRTRLGNRTVIARAAREDRQDR